VLLYDVGMQVLPFSRKVMEVIEMSYQSRLFVTLTVVTLAFAIVAYGAIRPTQLLAVNPLDDAITYQGRLTAPDGSPRSGEHTIRFLIYDSLSGGSSLWDSGEMLIQVDNGLVNAQLNVQHADFAGQARWLEVIVEGETLSPRQAIRPTPYALSLRPGATIQQVATGPALRLEAQDRGLFVLGQNFGVVGEASAAQTGAGYGGYFTSDTGIGAYGASSAQPSQQNDTAAGVWGYSLHGIGVVGESGSTGGLGVLGRVASGTGISGQSGGTGLIGTGAAFGVRGTGNASAQGAGYGGYFQSSTGAGVHGRSTATSSSQNQFAPGVWGYSENGAAIYGQAGGSGLAGYFDGNVSVIGNLTVTGSKAGYVVDVALNDGAVALEVGDVVKVTGVAPAVIGEIPVPMVARTDSPYDRAVIGVVAGAYDPDGLNANAGTAVSNGSYLTIVTLGAYAAVKVDAKYGEIRPGDLLVSSATPGYAQAVPVHENPPTGTVLGKALEEWSHGTGVIAVLVNMQ